MGSLLWTELLDIVRAVSRDPSVVSLPAAVHPERRLFLREMGPGDAGRQDREVQHHDSHGFPVLDNRVRPLASGSPDIVSACQAKPHHHLRPAFWLRVRQQYHARSRLRRPAVQDRGLWEVLCNVLHGGWHGHFGQYPHRRRNTEETRGKLCGLDRFRRDELRRRSGALHVGEDPSCGLGVDEREHFLKNLIPNILSFRAHCIHALI